MQMFARNNIAASLAIATAALLTACGASPPAATTDADRAGAPAPSTAAATTPAPARTEPPAASPVAPAAQGAPDATPAFVGKVWRVVESSGVQVGQRYSFLADGTLVIEAPNGDPPGYGKWRQENGGLIMEEEGIAYPTDVLHADANRLALRSHNPGGTLDITLEPAPGATLPTAP